MGRQDKTRPTRSTKRTCNRRDRSRIARLRTSVKLCRRCGLYKVRHATAFGEGSVPADIAFIGEGPGKAEDMLGRVWVGPAGKLLRKTLALLQAQVRPFTFYLLNLVCCHPTDEISGPNRAPAEEEIAACLPRLTKQLDEVDPQIIVALGKVPFGFVKKKYPSARFAYHPSYIVRSGGSNMQGSIFVQWYRQLEEAIKL